jgi:SAM-dependent methyltransferase
MIRLERCPSCEHDALDAVALPTDLQGQDHVLAARWGDSDFRLCRRCELLFAGRRQGPDEAEEYYRCFMELERRDYAVYPPPALFVENQVRYASDEMGRLHAAGLIRPGMRVLHVRCECGAHLRELRERYGLQELYGLDHFDSNLRFAREDFGLRHVAPLHPVRLELPFACREFDLILAHHQLTHALDPAGMMRQLLELLAPGGALVLHGEIDHEQWFRRYGSHGEGIITFHKQILTRNSLSNFCRGFGLSPRLLHYYAEGLKWARSHCSMTLSATRQTGAEGERLLADLPAFEQAIHLWLRRCHPAPWSLRAMKRRLRRTFSRT